MASVEERVVNITFDNKAFEANVSETISSIDKLNKALAFKDGTKGLDELSKAGGKIDLSGIASNVEKIREANLLLLELLDSLLFHLSLRVLLQHGQETGWGYSWAYNQWWNSKSQKH